MRPLTLALALATMLGCRATTPPPEVEHVGQLAPSYASIRPPAPVAKPAPAVEAVMVSREEAPAARVETTEESAPEVTEKRFGLEGVR